MNREKSEKLFAQALNLIPGGVNSPVRACKAVGSNPIFVNSGLGARIWDVDGNEYLDFVSSWGPLIFGHSPSFVNQAVKECMEKGSSFGAPVEDEYLLAKEVVELFPSIEMLRLVSSGTEAAMSAIRLARAYTGRDKILKFSGCYHGHADSLLVAAGSGLATLGIPSCPGIPSDLAKLTISIPYNDLNALQEAFIQHGSSLAAVIIEPVAANMGVVLPEAGFLKKIEELCKTNNVLFICDEVITGFRLSLGGAQKLYNINPDLTILGKILGGGLPMAAFGGRRDIMELLAPVGQVYQAGTLAGNPLAAAAGLAVIRALKKEPELYRRINALSQELATGLLEIGKSCGLPVSSNQSGSISTLFFTDQHVTNYDLAQKSDTKLYGKFWRAMLNKGFWLPPSQFEAIFVSGVHNQHDISLFLSAANEVLKAI